MYIISEMGYAEHSKNCPLFIKACKVQGSNKIKKKFNFFLKCFYLIVRSYELLFLNDFYDLNFDVCTMDELLIVGAIFPLRHMRR